MWRPFRTAGTLWPVPQTTGRYLSLDVLRGLAILGTLGTNIWIFTNPEGFPGYISYANLPSGAWLWTERILQQLAQGKFLGLLTVMFGIGLAIQQRSAARRGNRWPGKYPLRALLLFIDGTVHYLLVTEFDVLMGYAVTGLIVAYLLAKSDRAQQFWMYGLAAVHVVFMVVLAVGVARGGLAGNGAREPLDPNPYADGSWWDLVVFRADNIVLFRLEPVFITAMSISLFLAGARLYNAGVLAPSGALIRKRLIIAGLAVAAPIDFLVGVQGGNAILVTRYLTAPVVALGILGLVAGWYVRRDKLGFAGRRLSEVGRTALSCYILQNIVASVICYGWGFGAAQHVSREAYVPFTIAVYVTTVLIILCCAHVWLRRFTRGPVEWLWHASYRALARSG